MFLTTIRGRLNLCEFKCGNDHLSCHAILKSGGDSIFKVGLFNNEGSEIFISTWGGLLIPMKRIFHAEAIREAYWKSVEHIGNVRSILSD